MTQEIEIFDIIDAGGNVLEESLTMMEAADAIMRSDGREWELRPHKAGGFVAWSRQQVANRPWAEVSPLYSAESDEGAALADISRQIVTAERWPGHDEAVNRERRIAGEANIAREAFADADKDELRQAVRCHFNCEDVDIDEAGDVWIARPMTGHWLDDAGLIALHKALA